MQSKRYIMLRSARLVNATRHRTEGRSILMDMGAGEMPEDISRVRSDSSSSPHVSVVASMYAHATATRCCAPCSCLVHTMRTWRARLMTWA